MLKKSVTLVFFLFFLPSKIKKITTKFSFKKKKKNSTKFQILAANSDFQFASSSTRRKKPWRACRLVVPNPNGKTWIPSSLLSCSIPLNFVYSNKNTKMATKSDPKVCVLLKEGEDEDQEAKKQKRNEAAEEEQKNKQVICCAVLLSLLVF